MKKQATKFFRLIEASSGCWVEEDPSPAKSAGDFALNTLEAMGYSVEEVEPPEDPNQTKFKFAVEFENAELGDEG